MALHLFIAVPNQPERYLKYDKQAWYEIVGQMLTLSENYSFLLCLSSVSLCYPNLPLFKAIIILILQVLCLNHDSLL